MDQSNQVPARDVAKDIREVQQTQRILQNVDRLLSEATYPGSKHATVSEGIAFIRHLKAQSEGILNTLQDELKAQKKASKQDLEVVNPTTEAISEQAANG